MSRPAHPGELGALRLVPLEPELPPALDAERRVVAFKDEIHAFAKPGNRATILEVTTADGTTARRPKVWNVQLREAPRRHSLPMHCRRPLLTAATFALIAIVALRAADPAVPAPPPGHPRLYLRAADVAKLPARLAHPALAPVVARLERNAARSAQARVEWQALQQLVHPDAAAARTIITDTLALLTACQLADRQDACRETGRMMVTGAIVYDWLYARLTAEEKRAFIVQLVRLARTQECGYPPTRGGSVTGHASEAMIMRDLISAGIAIHDEEPEMYRAAAGRFFREHLPARNWFYPGGAYHQGDSYGAHRYSWDLFPLFIFDRLGAGNVYHAAQRFVPSCGSTPRGPTASACGPATRSSTARRGASRGTNSAARSSPRVITATACC